MNEKQYLRANKRVFLAVTIIFSYITLTMFAALAASHGDHFVRIMIQCLVSVGVIILSALGYLTRKKTHTCAIILTTAMIDRKSTRLNSSHRLESRMPSSA